MGETMSQTKRMIQQLSTNLLICNGRASGRSTSRRITALLSADLSAMPGDHWRDLFQAQPQPPAGVT